MIDKNLWTRFYELYKQYVAGYEKYSEAEISFELDEIAGGLLPTLLESLFNAWFPELKEVELIEVGDGDKYRLYGYEAYTALWYAISSEELYNYFNSRSEKVITPYTEKEELFIKRYSNNELETEIKEGYRNFDLKPLTEEERFIKKLVDTPKPPRGQRRKLQLYGDKGERES